MSIISTITRIRTKVEEVVQARLPEYLLDRGVRYHARPGLRKECDCTYCLEKVAATTAIGFAKAPLWRGDPDLAYFRLVRLKNRCRARLIEKKKEIIILA